jgi:hydroxymethylbilane synthase
MCIHAFRSWSVNICAARLNLCSKPEDRGLFAGICLAVAGLERLGLGHRVSQVLNSEVCPYAVGQGAIAVVCREDDTSTFDLVAKLNHAATSLACAAERSMLRLVMHMMELGINGVHR